MGASEILQGMQELVGTNPSVNLTFMYDGLQLIMEYSSLLLGLLVVIILIATPVIVALEVMYINFPTMQSGVHIALDKLNKKNSKVLEKTLTVMFRDANRAIVEANTLQTGRSANMAYLIIKVKTVLIMVVIIGIVIGPLQQIILFLVNLVLKVASTF